MFMKKYLSLILLVLFSPVIADYQIDTDVSSVSVCPSNFEVINLNLINYGSQDLFTLSTAGSAATFTSISQNGFSLDSNSIGSSKIYVSPNQYVKPGNYELEIIVSSNNERSKKIKVNVNVNNCDTSSLTFDNYERTVCVGDTADFNGLITNEGIWTNSYSVFSNNKFSDKISFSENNLFVESGESNSFNVFFKTDKIRTYDFEIVSEYNNNEINSNLRVNSIDCYNFDLSVDEDLISACSNSEITVPYFIENFGSENDEYNLELLGEPNWASLSKENLFVNSNSNSNGNLLFLPKLDDVGEYQISLKATSESNNKEEEVNLLLNILDCRKSSTTIEKEFFEVCPGDEISNKLTISNDGSFDERVKVNVNSIDTLKLENNEFLLNSKNVKELNYNIKIPESLSSGIYDIDFSTSFPNSEKVHENSMKLSVLPFESCYNYDIELRNSVELTSGSSNMIPIQISNTGLRNINLNLDIFGDAISFTDLSSAQIELNSKQSITESLFISVPRDSVNEEYAIELVSNSDFGKETNNNLLIKTKESRLSIIKNNINNINNNVSDSFYQLFNHTNEHIDEYYNKLSNYLSGINNRLIDFWYVFLILIIGLFGYTYMLNKNWKYDLDLLEKELDEKENKSNKFKEIYSKIKSWKNKNKVIKKTIKKPKTKVNKNRLNIIKNYKDRFFKWLEKEQTPKNSKSLWNRFLDWLDEDSKSENKKIKTKKITKKKSNSNKKSLWNRFLDWLEED